MRYEAKTVEEAVEGAARALGKTAAELKYTVIRDEKSFWGGRVVEIEVQEDGGAAAGQSGRPAPEPDEAPADMAREAAEAFEGQPAPAMEPAARQPREPRAPREREREKEPRGPREPRESLPGATDAEAVTLVESTLTELLSAAGLLVEIRRRESTGDELLFELIGDDVEPLLANKGEGLTGLEVLVGRIAAKRLGKPVHPRLDADGFRAHRQDALEELARQSADEVRRSRRPQLLPPLAPWERRLVHLALAEAADVETESEGDGFLKRVEVRLKRG